MLYVHPGHLGWLWACCPQKGAMAACLGGTSTAPLRLLFATVVFRGGSCAEAALEFLSAASRCAAAALNSSMALHQCKPRPAAGQPSARQGGCAGARAGCCNPPCCTCAPATRRCPPHCNARHGHPQPPRGLHMPMLYPAVAGMAWHPLEARRQGCEGVERRRRRSLGRRLLRLPRPGAAAAAVVAHAPLRLGSRDRARGSGTAG